MGRFKKKTKKIGFALNCDKPRWIELVYGVYRGVCTLALNPQKK